MEGSQIYIMNADGSGLIPLTRLSSTKWFPAWLPDGSAVVYQGWSPEWGEYVGMVSVDTGAHLVLYQADAMTAFDLYPMENTFAVITDDGNGVNRLCMAAIDTPAALTCPAEGNYAAVNVQFGNNG
jgi:Tol biopolymer transport system component